MKLRACLARLWRGVREVFGDAAYEVYLERALPGRRLTREEFWLDSLSRRYSRPNRCC